MKRFVGTIFAVAFTFLLALSPMLVHAQSIRHGDGSTVIRTCEHGEQNGGCVRDDGSYYRQEESPVGRREIAESNQDNARNANPRGGRQRQQGPGPQGQGHRPQ